MAKKVNIKTVVPDSIKKAIKDKKDWMEKVQSGKLVLTNSKPKRIA
jgi:hypothetical protein